MEFSTDYDSVYPENFRRAPLDTHQLTTYNQKLFEDLIKILTPFETGDKVLTSSMVVPCIRVLKATMNTLSKKFSSKFVSTLKAD